MKNPSSKATIEIMIDETLTELFTPLPAFDETDDEITQEMTTDELSKASFRSRVACRLAAMNGSVRQAAKRFIPMDEW